MKYLLITIVLMLSNHALAEQNCETNGDTKTCRSEKTTETDVNTDVPEDLKDAKIIIITKDGKKHTVSSNKFKVVKRKQQFKTVEKDVEVSQVRTVYLPQVVQINMVEPEQHKNLVTLGGRYDYTHLSATQDGNTVTLYSQRTVILDLGYYRRMILGNWGLGVSLDTNVTPRGVIGYEF